MREILFRGKRSDNGEWVYGSLVIQSGEWLNKDEKATDEYLIYGKRGEIYLVDSSTVGQYTGLTDKNGKKIFEGDIVKGFYKPTDKLVCGSVKYENHLARMLILNRGVCAGLSHCHHVEVIGNIHDNPELL